MKIQPACSLFKRVGGCIALAIVLFGAGRLYASDVLFQFDSVFPSNPNPAGPAPWIEACFQDVSPGTVRLTISNANLAAGEFVGGRGSGANGGLFFNLNSGLSAASLIFSDYSSSGSFTAPTILLGNDGFKADGDGLYDIRFDFATGGSDADRFTGNDSLTYTITGIGTLAAADFGYLSKPAGGNGPFYAAAHVQGLPGDDSTWIAPAQLAVIPIPEPSTVAVFALGAGVLGLALRRKSF
jgi:hypothetical protein